jgi:hypothetical protein
MAPTIRESQPNRKNLFFKTNPFLQNAKSMLAAAMPRNTLLFGAFRI